MANTLLLKRSGSATETPTAGELSYGELAINYADGKLYFKNSNNSVVQFLSSPGTAAGQALFSNGSTFTGDNDFFWDNTNKRLGVGTASPGHTLEIASSAVQSNEYMVSLINTYGDDGPGSSVLELQGGANEADGFILHAKRKDSGDPVLVATGAGKVGIGTDAPSTQLHLISTTNEKLRIGYDVNNYTKFEVGSNGNLAITTVDSDGTDGDISLMPDGDVGIGTASPERLLHITEASGSTYVRIGNNLSDPGILEFEAARSPGIGEQQSMGEIRWSNNNFTNTPISIVGYIGGSGAAQKLGVSFDGTEKFSVDQNGHAAFAGNVSAGSGLEVDGAVDIDADADSGLNIANAGTNAISLYAKSGDDLYLGSNNTYGVHFNSSNNATFAGTINSGAITSTAHIITGGVIKIPTNTFFQSSNASGTTRNVLAYNPSGLTDAAVLNGADSGGVVLAINETAKLTIASSGNATFAGKVDIGTAQSGYHLNVQSSAYGGSGRFANTYASGTAYGVIAQTEGAATIGKALYLYAVNAGTNYAIHAEAGDVYIQSGKVGIGTTTFGANDKLNVVGTGNTEVNFQAGSTNNLDMRFGDGTDRWALAYNGGNNNISFYNNAGSLHALTLLNTTGEARFSDYVLHKGKQDHVGNTSSQSYYRTALNAGYIDFPTITIGKGDFTLEAWFRPDRVGSDRAAAHNLLLGYTGANHQLFFNYHSDGDANYNDRILLGGLLTNVSSYALQLKTTGRGSITAGKWSHIVAVVDRDDLSNSAIYINGVDYTDRSSNYLKDDGANSISYPFFACYGGSSSNWDGGDMGGLKIFNNALSSSEVKELYSGGSIPYKYKGANNTSLATNGDFTSDTNGWTGVRCSVSSTSNYMTLDAADSGQANDQYAYGTFSTALINGKKYRFTGSVKSGTSGDQTFVMGIGTAGISGAGGYTGNERRGVTGTSSGAWVEYSFEFVAGADDAGADGMDNYDHLWVEKGSNHTGTMLFDSISVVQIGAMTEWDGSGATSDTWYDKSGNNINGAVSGSTSLENRLSALEVSGDASTYLKVRGGSIGSNATLQLYEQSTLMWTINADGGSSDTLMFNDTAGNYNMVLLQGGNVGIGTNSPATSSHVFGGQHLLTLGGATTDSFSVLEISGKDGDDNAYVGAIEFINKTNTDADGAHSEGIAAISAITRTNASNSAGESGSELQFWTKAINANTTEQMRIDDEGKLGIGTENPQSHLHVEGAGAQWVQIESTDNTSSGLKLVRSNTDNADFSIANNGAVLEIKSHNDIPNNAGTLLFKMSDTSGDSTFTGDVTLGNPSGHSYLTMKCSDGGEDGIIFGDAGGTQRAKIACDTQSATHAHGDLQFYVGGGYALGINRDRVSEFQADVTVAGDVTLTGASGLNTHIDSAGHAYSKIDCGSASYDAGLYLYTAGSPKWIVGMRSAVGGDNDFNINYYNGSAWSEPLRIDTSNNATFAGNIGVGLAPTNPSGMGQTIELAKAAADLQILVWAKTDSLSDNARIGEIAFAAGADSTEPVQAAMTAWVSGTDENQGYLKFHTRGSGESGGLPPEALRIDSNKLATFAGNVRLNDDYTIEWGGTNSRINGSNANNRLKFYTADTPRMIIDNTNIVAYNHIKPAVDNSVDLGDSGARFANLYVADVQMNNEGTGGNDVDGTEGSWTIQEGEDDLFLLNRKNGKKYKFKLEVV